jgi:pimeloyl-ACP methyl ester carboxylesterase
MLYIWGMDNSGIGAVMLVPGIVNPVGLSYGPLVEVLTGERRIILKELEVYLREEVPPVGYGVGVEADGIVRAADAAHVDSFHLVGYSAGGISALAAIDRYPERLRSVTLIEPFGTGSYETSWAERAFLDYTATVLALPMEERVGAFLPMNLAEGVEAPRSAPGPAPEWMGPRPMGIEGLIRGAIAARFDVERLRAFEKPVYFVMGSLSNRAWYAMGDTLQGIFPNIEVEVYEGLHHLTPPQRTRPEKFAERLRDMWSEGDRLAEGDR